MLEGAKRYLRKYPYTVLGPLWLKMKDEATSGQLALLSRKTSSRCPTSACAHWLCTRSGPATSTSEIHRRRRRLSALATAELHPQANDPTGEKLHRALLWTIYLNDGFTEGETEFLHQRRRSHQTPDRC